MSHTIPFSIVDVFSSTAFKGNPLAVVNDLSSTLSTTQMQLITRQFNLSETTFINPPTIPNAAFRLRSFLPDGKEVFGAGHNSLGALWWLAKHGHLQDIVAAVKEGDASTLRFNFSQQMGDDELPVSIMQGADGELAVTLQQVPPQYYGIHNNLASLAQVLGIDKHDIGFEFGGKQIRDAQVVSTSSSRHLLVPIANVTVLTSIKLRDRDALLREIVSVDALAYGMYLFTPSPLISSTKEGVRSPVFQARFFSPGMAGEDPATGSAAGPLAAYLQNEGALSVKQGENREISVLQGLRVGRACLLTVGVERGEKGDGVGGGINISLSGGGAEVMTGEVVIPGGDVEF
ncbi:hypothetical protein ACJ72_08244 [Emergomyces africanus]|uniref:Phenazine biosynthesis protein n=1 Tax=Emergomyces africanus TaxID=1955775 RepID=A0A1B7NL80_9EURO|nr:hypothetical protein ACJ72_08244 [Emergomyces africanus]